MAQWVAGGPWHKDLRHWGGCRKCTPETVPPPPAPLGGSSYQGPCPRDRTVRSDYTLGRGLAEMSSPDKSPRPPVGTAPRAAVLLMAAAWSNRRDPARVAGASMLDAGHGWHCSLPAGVTQSSMASSWSARASNMVLISSRMCLVDVPGGPFRSSVQMLFSAARNAAARDELVCSSLCWAWPEPVAPVLSGLGGGTGRGPSRGGSLGPENASWVQATDTGLGAVPAPGTLMRAAGGAGSSVSACLRLLAEFSRAGPGQESTGCWAWGLRERGAGAP